jgi:hypothetical protein
VNVIITAMAKVVVDAVQGSRMRGDVTDLRTLAVNLEHLHTAPFFDIPDR